MVSTDPEQLIRGLELLRVTRDDIEAVRGAPNADAAAERLTALRTRARSIGREVVRSLHPDLVGDLADDADTRAADLRAVLVAADWLRDFEAPRHLGRPSFTVRRVDMSIRVEIDHSAPHWSDV